MLLVPSLARHQTIFRFQIESMWHPLPIQNMTNNTLDVKTLTDAGFLSVATAGFVSVTDAGFLSRLTVGFV